jgi:hypothetical protein
MKKDQLHELLYQAYETELGGVEVYKYHKQTTNHVEIAEGLLRAFALDPQVATPGRAVVRHTGKALVKAMEMALKNGSADAAELVAAECVTLAETKDHLNWELLGQAAQKTKGEQGTALRAARKEVEEQEDEHLYHTTGWTRELWISSLGLPAVLPPPEEQKDVKTAIGAARAKQVRGDMT